VKETSVSKSLCILFSLWLAAAASAYAADSGVALKGDVIRAEPFKDADSIGDLKKGESVQIMSKKGGWLQIKAAGGEGWVRMLSVKRGAGGGSNAAGEIGGIAAMSTGRAGTGQITSATGVRGLSEEDLKAAKYDAAELARAEGNAVSAAVAGQFANAGKLVTQNVAFLPEPRPASTNTPTPGRQ
jgi:uncharacterized protein YraI